jgi:hypothetical protein
VLTGGAGDQEKFQMIAPDLLYLLYKKTSEQSVKY